MLDNVYLIELELALDMDYIELCRTANLSGAPIHKEKIRLEGRPLWWKDAINGADDPAFEIKLLNRRIVILGQKGNSTVWVERLSW